MRLKGSKIIALFIMLLPGIGGSMRAYAQTPNTNYLRIRIPQIPVTDTLKLDTIPVQRQTISLNYNDALGRSWQTVKMQGSPAKKDIIIPFAYDNMGRVPKSYLPFIDPATNGSTKGTFRNNAITSAVGFYSPLSPGVPKIATDTAPYKQIVYETSPLAREKEFGELGSVFQPGTGHTIRISNGVSTASDAIAIYNVTAYGSAGSTRPYPAGSLTKIIITDENGHRTAIWKDLQGRTVTKLQLDAPTNYYGTDYVYNDLDQLSYIVPPSAKAQAQANISNSVH